MGWNKWKKKYKRTGQQKGYDFEDEFAKSLGHYMVYTERIFFYKLPDSHSFRSALQRITNMFYELPTSIQQKYQWVIYSFKHLTLPKQPGDFFLIVTGKGGVIELKSISTNEPFYLKNIIKEHQISYASKIELYGKGFYYLVFCDRRLEREHVGYVFTRSNILEALVAEAQRKRGWTIEELIHYSIMRRTTDVKDKWKWIVIDLIKLIKEEGK